MQIKRIDKSVPVTAHPEDKLAEAPDMRCPCGKEWKPPAGWGLYCEREVDGLVETINELLRDKEFLQGALTRALEGAKKKTRKTKFQKIAAIAKYLEARPTAFSKEVGKATGIDDSDVRHLWGPIKMALKEGKSPLPDGYKYEGRTEAIDLSASCKYCQEPLRSSFQCDECGEIIVGECKTCHFTQSHPEKAVP